MAFPPATWQLYMRRVNPDGPLIVAGLVDDATLSRADTTGSAGGSGTGGWQIVDRPRRKASTEWLDYSPFSLSFQFILDGGEGLTPNLVEDAINEIESWELPAPGGIEPPKLALLGPVPHNDLFWVVQSLRWKEAYRDPTSGGRFQQMGELKLLEYSPPSVLLSEISSPAAVAQQAAASAAPPPTAAGGSLLATGATVAGFGATTAGGSLLSTGASVANGGSPPASGNTYTVQSGDTLSGIAARLLGNANRWTDIASLNGIRDPRAIQPGQVLKLPAAVQGPPGGLNLPTNSRNGPS